MAKIVSRLPKKLYPYFWDTSPGKIDIYQNDMYVAERVMDWGDTADIAWLIKTYGKNFLAKVVRKRRGLSRKSAWFWADLLGVNHQEVACLQKPYHGQPFVL